MGNWLKVKLMRRLNWKSCNYGERRPAFAKASAGKAGGRLKVNSIKLFQHSDWPGKPVTVYPVKGNIFASE
jgi:hypothetical protein